MVAPTEVITDNPHIDQSKVHEAGYAAEFVGILSSSLCHVVSQFAQTFVHEAACRLNEAADYHLHTCSLYYT